MRQALQHGALGIDPLGVAGIVAADDLVDEAAVSGKVIEVGGAAQQQRVEDRPLEVAVGSLDRAVLMGDAAVVAGRPHAVMGTKILVPVRQIIPRVPIEIAEGGRQTVGPMLPRRADERPQGILQPFGQGDEALATQHDMGVLKPGIGQPEVVEAVIERRSGDADAQLAHVGEVGEADLAGLVGLAEDHFLLLAVDRPPGPDPALQRAANAGPEFRVPSQDLFEDRNRPHAGRGLQHRHDLGLKYAGQGIRPATAAGSLLPRWKAGILLHPISG